LIFYSCHIDVTQGKNDDPETAENPSTMQSPGVFSCFSYAELLNCRRRARTHLLQFAMIPTLAMSFRVLHKAQESYAALQHTIISGSTTC
jgi:hypothetical protein